MSNPSSRAAGQSWPTPGAPGSGARRGGGWIGPTALALAAGMLVIVALVRVIVGIPKVSQSYYNAVYRALDSGPVIWLILGLLLLVSIVPIGAAVVLGHVGLSRAKAAGTRAATAGIALGIGYTLVVFWGVRLINAITNSAQFDGGVRMFIEHLALWA